MADDTGVQGGRPGPGSGPQSTITIGTVISTGGEDWLLLNEIGGGGMGRVFRALPVTTMVATHHQSRSTGEPLPLGISQCEPELFRLIAAEALQRPTFVLKLLDLPPTHPYYGELVERLMQEAELCGTMGSPQFPIFAGTARRRPIPFFVMELIQGTSLLDFLTDRYFSKRLEVPWTTVYSIMGQLLAAMRESHRRGCIHRDLKYDNVMVMEMAPFGLFVRVIDFGIAKVLPDPRPGLEHLVGAEGRRARQITTGSSPLVATPAFAPPELYKPPGERRITPATDIYELGGILFWMATGDTFLPQTADTAVLGQAMSRPVPRIVRADLGARSNALLNQLVAKTLAFDQAQRPQNLDEVIAALERIEQARLREEAEKALLASRPTTPTVVPSPVIPRRGRVGISPTVLALASLGAAIVGASLALAATRLF